MTSYELVFWTLAVTPTLKSRGDLYSEPSRNLYSGVSMNKYSDFSYTTLFPALNHTVGIGGKGGVDDLIIG